MYRPIYDKIIDLPNGGFIGGDNCDFYDVYHIGIDGKEVHIFDEWGYLRGKIGNFEEEDIIEFFHYAGEEIVENEVVSLVKNGKLVI